MNFYLIPALALAFILNGFYWNYHGRQSAQTQCETQIEIERATAMGLARALEQQQQQKTNQALQEQHEKVTHLNTQLQRELNGLRQRAPRAVSHAARTACAGSTGAELSKEDGEFLIREATRADEVRVGLETCYAVIEAVHDR